MSNSQALSVSLVNLSTKFKDLEPLNEAGLVGISEDLSPELVWNAYRGGAFPWYKFLKVYWWYSPEPRMVLFPDEIYVSKSMRKVIRNEEFELTANRAFEAVVSSCAKAPRRDQEGTWITEDFMEAYSALNVEGKAHSIEVWKANELVGGLYGVSIGDVFYGESMFTLVPNASKRAFIALARGELLQSYQLIDCQVYTEHLESLGARLVMRGDFLKMLTEFTSKTAS